jgi:hypothetical protein
MRFQLGFISVLVLIAQIWAAVNIIGSQASTGAKAGWIALVVLLPVAGFLIWLLAGPRSS